MTTPRRFRNYLTLALSCAGISSTQAYELKFGTNLPPIDVHGFASQGFLYSTDYDYLGDTTSGSFRFTEAGLNISLSPLPRTRIAAQAFLFDVGGVGEYEPFLDYASIEYTVNNYVGVRVGRVRKSGGIYNHIQDVDLARTWVLLPQGIYDARWREFSTSVDGGVLFGNVPMSKAGGLSYELFGGMANVSEDGGVGGIIQNAFYEQSLAPGMPLLGIDSIDSVPLAGGQLWWNTPVSGLRLGALYAHVFNFDYEFSGEVAPGMGRVVNKSESHINLQQYSLEYLWNSWTFQAEYQNMAIFGDVATSYTVLPLPSSVTVRNSRSDSWYVGAAYRFNQYMEAGSYYSEYYADTGDRDGSGRSGARSDGNQRDWAFLSLRFDPTDWLIFKMEGHYIRGTALVHDARSNPDRTKDGWFLFATKATVSF